MTILDALGKSVLGMMIVFAVLLILMGCIYVMSIFFKKDKKASGSNSKKTNSEDAPVTNLAKGTFGDVKLFDVPDKTAAMVMAIVADKLDTPLNQLRFISIKEIAE